MPIRQMTDRFHILRMDVSTALRLALALEAIARWLWPWLPKSVPVFDGVLCDPPYGYSFMGAAWDHGVPSAEVWALIAQHVKPGGSVLAFGATRMFHRLMVAMEDGGLVINPTIRVEGYEHALVEPATVHAWTQGQGGGWQGQNISKAIDKAAGADREVIGPSPIQRKASLGMSQQSDITTPATSNAARFDGYHTMLAPSWEPVVMAEVPRDGTYAHNAVEHGVAGYNVDGCRVGDQERARMVLHPNRDHNNHSTGGNKSSQTSKGGGTTTKGRWPANWILLCDEALCGPGDPAAIEHHPLCHVARLDAMASPSTSRKGRPRTSKGPAGRGFHSTHTGAEHSDSGGPSRYFYTGKVGRSERGVSAHPCMKPLALTTYLARLILPPPRKDGRPRILLVPFSGSGSEMVGGLLAGWDFVVGIEWDASAQNKGKRPDYWADVAEYRIRERLGTLKAEHIKPDISDGKATQLGLFG